MKNTATHSSVVKEHSGAIEDRLGVDLRTLVALRAFGLRSQCNFMDFTNADKSQLREAQQRVVTPTNQESSALLLRTCVRVECYQFHPWALVELPELRARRMGTSALKRLLLIACGMHSEILGETEVLIQVKEAIDRNYRDGRLHSADYLWLRELTHVAEAIRADSGLTSGENYSSIAARMIESHFGLGRIPCLLIAGAGYMAGSFIKQIRCPIERLVWVNRSVSNAKRCWGECRDSMKYGVNQVDFFMLDKLESLTGEADVVFAALGSDDKELSQRFHVPARPDKPSLIVDISAAPLFRSAGSGVFLRDMKNTRFADFQKKAPSPEILARVHGAVDSIFN